MKVPCPLCGKLVGVAVNDTLYLHNAGVSTQKCKASNRNPEYFWADKYYVVYSRPPHSYREDV